MKRENLVAGAVACAIAAAVMIIVIERMMSGAAPEPAAKKTGPAAAVNASAPSRAGEQGEAALIRDYEINPKTGEKQFLR